MQTIKRLTALMLVLTLVFALAACSDTSGKNNIFDTQGNADSQKTEPAREDTAAATDATKPEPVDTVAPATNAVESHEGDPNDPFAAIGNPGIDNSVLGTWAYTLDYGKLMESVSEEELAQLGEMGEAVMEVYNGMTMEVVMDLRADGSFTFGIDEDSARDAVEEMIPKMAEIMVPLIASMSGMSVEDLEAELNKQGMTMDNFVEQFMGEINPDELVEQISESTKSGSWRYVDGKLYLVEDGGSVDPDQYMTIEPGNATLTVTAVPSNDASDEMYKSLLPMEFTRK